MKSKYIMFLAITTLFISTIISSFGLFSFYTKTEIIQKTMQFNLVTTFLLLSVLLFIIYIFMKQHEEKKMENEILERLHNAEISEN